MSGESVLAYSRMRAGREQVIGEPGFHHPPTDEALEANEAGDADEGPGHGDGDTTTSDEIGGGEDEGEADQPPPEAMRPLHEVDLLELGQVHVRVEHLEFGRRPVLFKFGLPVLLGERRERAGHGLPLGDAEASGGRRGAESAGATGTDCVASRRLAYPDSVSRVRPPNTTMPKTLAALPRSQYATDLEVVVSGNARFGFEARPAACAAVLIVARALTLKKDSVVAGLLVAVVEVVAVLLLAWRRGCRKDPRTREVVACDC